MISPEFLDFYEVKPPRPTTRAQASQELDIQIRLVMRATNSNYVTAFEKLRAEYPAFVDKWQAIQNRR